MEKIEFKSQISTTREQSERLLKLGLKKETADMMYITDANVPEEHRYYDLVPECYESCLEGIVHIPAWSLCRLFEMLPDSIKVMIDNMVDMVECLISEGLFDKDYLEENNESKN